MDLKISKKDRVVEPKAHKRKGMINYLSLSFFAHVMIIMAMVFSISKPTPKNPSPQKKNIVYASVIMAPPVNITQSAMGVEKVLPVTKNEHKEKPVENDVIPDAKPNKTNEKKDAFSDKMKALDNLLSKQIVEQVVSVDPEPKKVVDWGFDEINESTLQLDDTVVAKHDNNKPKVTEHPKTNQDESGEGIYIDPLISYQRKIVQALQGAMRIENSMIGSQCFLSLNISKDGMIVSAKPIRGKRVLCKAAEQASVRVGKLPMPDDQRLYPNLKNLTIIISP